MVRKLVIFVIFAVAAVAAVAAEVRVYEPMLVDGRSWKYRYGDDVLTQTVCGDTIFNGGVCKKIRCKLENSGEEWYKIAKEENGRVYNHYEWNEPYYICRSCLVYDFNVSVGHVSPTYDIMTGKQGVNGRTVIKDEYIESCGRKWRRLTVEDESDNKRYYIEGVGPYIYDDYGIFTTNASVSSNRQDISFLECQQGDEVIFKAEDLEAPALSDAGSMLAQYPQGYEPMLVDGRSWIYRYGDDVLTQTVCGDTIIQGEPGKKIHCKFGNSEEEWYSFAQEEYGKVYNYSDWRDYTSGIFMYKKHLIYDFNLSAGQIFRTYEDYDGSAVYDMTVTADEYIESCARKWRKLTIEDDYVAMCHIEGIGPYEESDYGEYHVMTTRGFSFGFLECRQENEVIFKAEDLDLPELPPSGVESVAVEDAQGSGMIFDIHGRRVEHPQRGHIYIRDGRKFVQR